MKACFCVAALFLAIGATAACHGQDVPCFEDVVVSGLTFDCANGVYEFSPNFVSHMGDYATNLGLRPTYYKMLTCYSGTARVEWDGGWQFVINFRPTGWIVWVTLRYTNASASYEPPSTGWVAEDMYCPYWCYDDSPRLSGGERCSVGVPGVSLEKSAHVVPVWAEDSFFYNFLVVNTGDVTLYDVSVYDETLGLPVPLEKTALEPGEWTEGELEYTVTQVDFDAGMLSNRATVEATTSGGDQVTASDSDLTTLYQRPELYLAKSAEEGPFYEGDTARFTFALTNTGNVTLERLTVWDEATGSNMSLSLNSLPPGASTTVSVDYIVTAADAAAGSFTNDGLAEAWTVYGVRAEDDAQATIVCLLRPEEGGDVEPLPENVTTEIRLAPSELDAAEATYCQGETLHITVAVLDGQGLPMPDATVHTRLYSGVGSDRTAIALAQSTYADGQYSASFDTVLFEAGKYAVRAWVSGAYTDLLPIELVACGANVDSDGVSDAVDACPNVAGIAENSGCPRGDLDHTGVPDALECEGETLVETAYPVRIVVETSSDWTSVSLHHGEILLVSAERDGSPMWGYTGLLEMNVTKPCCQPNSVRATYDAYVFDLDGAELEWMIAKGGLGRTTLSVYAYPDESEPESALELIYETKYWRDVGADEEVAPWTSRQNASDLTEGIEAVSLDESCEKTTVQPLVLALYSTEYGTPDGPAGVWEGWRPDRTNYGAVCVPSSGPYDSGDAHVIDEHLRLVSESGIDALLCPWSGGDTWSDIALGALLDAAAETDVRVAIYLESSRQVTEWLRAFNEAYGGHPALLLVAGQPVVFFRRNMRGSVDWEADLLPLHTEGFHAFGILDGIDLDRPGVLEGFALDPLKPDFGEVFDRTLLGSKASRASLLAGVVGSVFVAVVSPGGVGEFPLSGTFDVPRDDGAVYRAMWDAATASDPDWILIHSFNFWMDGSAIEPSAEFGGTYLDITRQYIVAWNAMELAEDR